MIIERPKQAGCDYLSSGTKTSATGVHFQDGEP